MRIVSLLPSATEMICALGLEGSLVGTSHECDYPPSVAGLPAVTETFVDHHASSAEIDRQVRLELDRRQALYSLRQDVLRELRPDLIVTQSLCDVCAVAENEVSSAAAALDSVPSVFNMQPFDLADVLEAVRALANAADTAAAGAALHRELVQRIEAVRSRSSGIPAGKRPRVAFLEWLDPPFNAGHWTPELIEIAGGTALLGQPGLASHTITWDEIARAEPERIIVGCCGFDQRRSLRELELFDRTQWLGLRCVRDGEVYVVDGNAYFNRPGPRLIDSLELLAHILHPEIHPLPSNVNPAIRVRLEPR